MGGTHLGGGFVLGWEAGRVAAKGGEDVEEQPHTEAMFGQSVEKDGRVGLSMPIINVDAAQQQGSLKL
jgi:hypothetical protein